MILGFWMDCSSFWSLSLFAKDLWCPMASSTIWLPVPSVSDFAITLRMNKVSAKGCLQKPHQRTRNSPHGIPELGMISFPQCHISIWSNLWEGETPYPSMCLHLSLSLHQRKRSKLWVWWVSLKTKMACWILSSFLFWVYVCLQRAHI